jgi:DNA-binding transcriptional regulator YiaG
VSYYPTIARPLAKTIDAPCPSCGQPTAVPNGRYLRWLRERAGLTQRAFGRRVGASSPYVSDWERNRRAVPPRVLQAYRALRRRAKGFTP